MCLLQSSTPPPPDQGVALRTQVLHVVEGLDGERKQTASAPATDQTNATTQEPLEETLPRLGLGPDHQNHSRKKVI